MQDRRKFLGAFHDPDPDSDKGAFFFEAKAEAPFECGACRAEGTHFQYAAGETLIEREIHTADSFGATVGPIFKLCLRHGMEALKLAERGERIK